MLIIDVSIIVSLSRKLVKENKPPLWKDYSWLATRLKNSFWYDFIGVEIVKSLSFRNHVRVVFFGSVFFNACLSRYRLSFDWNFLASEVINLFGVYTKLLRNVPHLIKVVYWQIPLRLAICVQEDALCRNISLFELDLAFNFVLCKEASFIYLLFIHISM